MTSTTTTRSSARSWTVPLVIVVASLGALIVGLLFGGGSWQPPVEGLPDAGPIVGWALPIARLAELLLGVITVAGLLYAAVMGPQGRDGVISAQGRQALVRTSLAALAWAGVSVLAAVLTVSSVLAVPFLDALSPRIFLTYAWDLSPSHSLLLTAIMAFLIGIGALFTSSITASFGWLIIALIGVAFPGLSGHAAGLGDHALALTSNILHQVAATLWMAGVVALIGAAIRRDPKIARSARVFSSLAVWVVAVLALSGLLSSATHLDSFTQLFTSGYGLLIVAKVVVLVALLLIARNLRERIIPRIEQSRAALGQLLLIEVGLLSIAMGLAVSLARTPSPRTVADLSTVAEQVLGYPFPLPPTYSTVLLGWHPDAFFLIAGILAAAFYIAAVLRLRARGDKWPPGRTIAWLLGIGTMMWATNAGIASYATMSMSLHMLQHMTLAMLAPILLVLGGPFTLALRAIPPAPHGTRGARELIVWALHSPLARFYTNPIVVLLLYTVGLYGLYFTPLFGLLMSSHIGHVLMTIHFLFSGYIFYWVVIGVDPVPKPIPYWAKLMLLLVSMVVHSFFALPIMNAVNPMSSEWFSQVQPPWLDSLLADTQTAGGIAWGFGEVPALIVLIALSVQWARDDTKIAKRRDRQVARDGDHELDEYNERLARLAAADAAREARER